MSPAQKKKPLLPPTHKRKSQVMVGDHETVIQQLQQMVLPTIESQQALATLPTRPRECMISIMTIYVHVYCHLSKI